MPQSDLPYVQAANGLERANPVFNIALGNWTDKSGTITAAGESQPLFPEADATVIDRFVYHAGDSGKIAVNFLNSEDAAVHGAGCFTLSPGKGIAIPTRGAVTITGDADGIPFTAAEC